MNYLDIIIVLCLTYAVWKGFKKGFIVEIFTLLALLIGLYAALHFSNWTSSWIQSNVESKMKHLPLISFTLTFLAVGAMIYFLGKTIEKLIDFANLSLINKILGITFSLVKMLYFLSVIFVLIESYDKHQNFVSKDAKFESKLYTPVKQLSLKTIPYFEEAKFYVDAQFADSTNTLKSDSLQNNKHEAH